MHRKLREGPAGAAENAFCSRYEAIFTTWSNQYCRDETSLKEFYQILQMGESDGMARGGGRIFVDFIFNQRLAITDYF